MTATQTVVYDVQDCKVYPLTSDAGASPVYSAGVDVFGINTASFDPSFASASLKGDGKVIATRSRIDMFTMSLTYGKLDMDVLEVILGTVSETIAGGLRNRWVAGTEIPHFAIGLMFNDLDSDVGSVHLIAYKTKMTGGSLLSSSSDAFVQPSFDVEAIGLFCPSEGGGFQDVTFDIMFYDVETALPSSLP